MSESPFPPGYWLLFSEDFDKQALTNRLQTSLLPNAIALPRDRWAVWGEFDRPGDIYLENFQDSPDDEPVLRVVHKSFSGHPYAFYISYMNREEISTDLDVAGNKVLHDAEELLEAPIACALAISVADGYDAFEPFLQHLLTADMRCIRCSTRPNNHMTTVGFVPKSLDVPDYLKIFDDCQPAGDATAAIPSCRDDSATAGKGLLCSHESSLAAAFRRAYLEVLPGGTYHEIGSVHMATNGVSSVTATRIDRDHPRWPNAAKTHEIEQETGHSLESVYELEIVDPDPARWLFWATWLGDFWIDDAGWEVRLTRHRSDASSPSRRRRIAGYVEMPPGISVHDVTTALGPAGARCFVPTDQIIEHQSWAIENDDDLLWFWRWEINGLGYGIQLAQLTDTGPTPPPEMLRGHALWHEAPVFGTRLRLVAYIWDGAHVDGRRVVSEHLVGALSCLSSLGPVLWLPDNGPVALFHNNNEPEWLGVSKECERR